MILFPSISAYFQSLLFDHNCCLVRFFQAEGTLKECLKGVWASTSQRGVDQRGLFRWMPRCFSRIPLWSWDPWKRQRWDSMGVGFLAEKPWVFLSIFFGWYTSYKIVFGLLFLVFVVYTLEVWQFAPENGLGLPKTKSKQSSNDPFLGARNVSFKEGRCEHMTADDILHFGDSVMQLTEM